jgi:FkbM family methyltransferase
MISYAQNLEDVVLDRVFKDIKIGFYIDLGASDSTLDSVTRHFYENGWSGLNIEPNPVNFTSLQRDRPRDKNLNVAVGETKGKQKFYSVLGNGLSTLDPNLGLSTLDPNLGEQYLQEFPASETIEVETLTVDDVIKESAVESTVVHFLKIDVEGYETIVLRNWRFDKVKPWVIVVEATQPRTQSPTHQLWEKFLTKAGYNFVYADGLNRFYLHKTKVELTPRFEFPPNVFDGYTRHADVLKDIQIDELKKELESIRLSKSWNMTSPLRRLGRLVKLPKGLK